MTGITLTRRASHSCNRADFSVLQRFRLLELRLRELLQRADGAGHFRSVRGRELDHPFAVELVFLLQADVTGIGDEDVDVGLAFDAHAGPSVQSMHRSAPTLTADQ